MEFCSSDPSSLIGNTNISWAQALNNSLAIGTNTSYLRPDNGGALIPWIYTVVIILAHVPTAIIRVVQWELAQTWCLVFTFVTIIIYVQAYVSTDFAASKILVWTPIILIIDAGSMLQLFFLVIEAKKEKVGGRDVVTDPAPPIEAHPSIDESTSLLVWYQTWKAHKAKVPTGGDESNGTEMQAQNSGGNTSVNRQQSKSSAPQISAAVYTSPIHPGWKKDQRVWVALLSAIFFVLVIALQVIGLVFAILANRKSELPEVNWCSTLFQPLGIVVVDRDCNVYDVRQNSNKGIGCIKLPGIYQQNWLKATIAVLIIEIILEIVDFVILYCVDINTKWRKAKMKRPWTTLFSGLIVLIGILICGIMYSSTLPPKITDKVMVLADIRGPASYNVVLTSAGLRGSIIGWNDGLFESWKATYFGS